MTAYQGKPVSTWKLTGGTANSTAAEYSGRYYSGQYYSGYLVTSDFKLVRDSGSDLTENRTRAAKYQAYTKVRNIT